ncbi:hypothetical protein, partial [Mesobacillus boroniphilus]|uniref:hypothetical protein n=1 Tax=Mesobacillus boroniphilus TaxID=308892 RepID=UPI001FB12076
FSSKLSVAENFIPFPTKKPQCNCIGFKHWYNRVRQFTPCFSFQIGEQNTAIACPKIFPSPTGIKILKLDYESSNFMVH